jgi:hypothetical protein
MDLVCPQDDNDFGVNIALFFLVSEANQVTSGGLPCQENGSRKEVFNPCTTRNAAVQHEALVRMDGPVPRSWPSEQPERVAACRTGL